MTAYAFDVIDQTTATNKTVARAVTSDEPSTGAYFVPVLEVAATIGVEPTTVRRMIWSTKVDAREGARGVEVNVATLPAKYRVAYVDRIVPAAPTLRLAESGATASRYNAVLKTGKERAEFRYEAVISLEKARAARLPGQTFGMIERRWLHNFRRRHPGRKVSLRSVKTWAEKLSGNIDALVDGNDGVKQRGDHIPVAAKRMFRDEYLRSHRPNIALIYGNVLAVA
jgi:hypothetical protein